MTLKELKEKCNSEGLQYAYGQFPKPTEPPHLVAITSYSNNFYADNKTYKKISNIQLIYTYIIKDEEIENKIENVILADIAWKKSEEEYYKDEAIWQITYEFEI